MDAALSADRRHEGARQMNKELTELLVKLDEMRADCPPKYSMVMSREEYDLLREALRERAGMVLVPREPTATMRLRGSLAIQDHYRRDGGWCGLASAQEQMHLTWNAMLAAAEGKK